MPKITMPLYFKDDEEKAKLKEMYEDMYSYMTFNGMFLHFALKEHEKWSRKKENK